MGPYLIMTGIASIYVGLEHSHFTYVLIGTIILYIGFRKTAGK